MRAEELSELQGLAEQVMKRALAGGADVAEVIARAGSELSVKVRLGEVELVEEAGHRSLGMRVMRGKRVSLTSTSDLSGPGVDRFLADALELAQLAQEDPFAGPADPALLSRGPSVDLELFDPAGGAIDAAQAITMAKAAEEAALKHDARITNSEGATFSRTAGGFALALSGGFSGGYSGSYQSLVVSPVVEDEGGKKRRGYHWSARRFLSELDAPASVGAEAARRTLAKLGARKVPSCEAPVIFDPDVARSMIGLLAGVLLGGSIWRKSSYLAGREGTAVASSLVTLVDDPLLPRAPGSRPFDGEGLASRHNLVVEEGILRSYLCDSYSGRKLGRLPTASASRGSSGGVSEGTSNFSLLPSALSPKDLLADTPRGLYVTEMMGFGFNAVTGDFSRGASGFWIENGKLSYPVSEVTISLNLDTLLKRIDAVASDLDRRTSIASPTFRVSSMTIAGA